MNSPFGLPPFDPSKMDPKVLMKLSQLIAQLPPDQVNRLQSLMHNMMAGFDVSKDLAQFERELPAGFRESLLSILNEQAVLDAGKQAPAPATGLAALSAAANEEPPASSSASPENMNIREARLTILRAVAEGRVSPEEAESLLFKDVL